LVGKHIAALLKKSIVKSSLGTNKQFSCVHCIDSC